MAHCIGNSVAAPQSGPTSTLTCRYRLSQMPPAAPEPPICQCKPAPTFICNVVLQPTGPVSAWRHHGSSQHNTAYGLNTAAHRKADQGPVRAPPTQGSAYLVQQPADECAHLVLSGSSQLHCTCDVLQAKEQQSTAQHSSKAAAQEANERQQQQAGTVGVGVSSWRRTLPGVRMARSLKTSAFTECT